MAATLAFALDPSSPFLGGKDAVLSGSVKRMHACSAALVAFPGRELKDGKEGGWMEKRKCLETVGSDVDFQGLCAAGRLGEVMDVLEKGGIQAPNKVYAQFMCKCGQMKALSEAKRMHRYLAGKRLDLDAYLGSGIVEMYVKCGRFADARKMHNRLPHRNEFSWTALISGYAGAGQGREALEVYQEMVQDGVKPSSYTFVQALKVCSRLGDWESGRRIHGYVVASGNGSDVFAGNTLIDMYAKCGSMGDAWDVFDKLPRRSVVSWNAMILGYAQKEEGEVALELYVEMQREGLTPDDRTFVGVLKACSSLATVEEVDGAGLRVQCLEKGRSIHCQVVKSGVESNTFVGNTMIDMYSKCGSMVDAHRVFDGLMCRDVVSWNAMILGYAEKQEGEVALRLYAWMQQEGITPDERSFIGALKACSSLATLEEGREVDGKTVKLQCLGKGRSIHSQVVKAGFESDVFVGTMLVDVYAKCGSMLDASDVFDKLPHHDVVLWNVMILGYAENQEAEVAWRLYAQMQELGFAPGDRTFVAALKACSNLAAVEEEMEVDGKLVKAGCLKRGRAIHADLAKAGFESDVFVGTTLADMYAKCGSMSEARHVFDKLHHRNVVSWNVMIQGYAEQGESEEVFKLYAQMQQQGLSANSVTFFNILRACGNTAALETGKAIHLEICRAGLESTDVIVATGLVDMYCKCGSMVDAQHVFDALPTHDLVTWSALIAGYARQGEAEPVFHLLNRMRQQGIQPNGVTFLSVLTLCSHGGLVDKGQEYFTLMSKEYGIVPTIEHFNCMVDLLGRAGQMDEVLGMLEQMPFQPDVVTWTTVLSACRKWNNVEVGRHAFECAMRTCERDAAVYVLMSNIYADAHMWEDRDRVWAMKDGARAWKKQGQSWWTDVGGTVHKFVVGDATHPQNDVIYAKLKDLSGKMEEEGYMPDLDCVLRDVSDDEKADALCGHSERLAIACALVNTPPGTPIRVVKNLRVCDDCHKATALISKLEGRQITCRDASRFHVFKDGKCSCGDYW